MISDLTDFVHYIPKWRLLEDILNEHLLEESMDARRPEIQTQIFLTVRDIFIP